MKCFTDSVGRTWTLTVNVNSLRRVKALCEVTLTDIVILEAGKRPDATLLERLANDPILLVDVLYALVQPEAEARKVSDEEFGAAMVGDTLDAAVSALLDEVIAFFPEAKRTVLQRLVEISRRFAQKQKEALDVLLASPELEQEVESILETSSTSASNSQES